MTEKFGHKPGNGDGMEMTNAEDYFFQGNELIRRNAFSEAIDCYQKAVRIGLDELPTIHIKTRNPPSKTGF